MQSDTVEQKAQKAQRDEGKQQQNDQGDCKDQREPAADFRRVGERPGDSAQRGDYRDREAQLQTACPPAGKPAADALRTLLDETAQNQHRADIAHIQQRRQTEEQRGQQSRSQTGGDRTPGKFQRCVNRKQFAEDRRQRGHYAHAGGHANETSGQAQA